MSSIRIVDSLEESPFTVLATRRVHIDSNVTETVARIIERVRAFGDGALLEYAHKFDSLNVQNVLVGGEELAGARVSEKDLAAIRTAIERVRSFHNAQLAALTEGWDQDDRGYTWVMANQAGRRASATSPLSSLPPPQSLIGQRMRPLRVVGIYVPGGKATYPSSVIMNSVPALCAGVPKLVMTSPAGADGNLSDAVLVAARECGIETIARVGGAAAVAAMALGTESVPRVDRVVGPGNRYVNEAKRQLWGQVGVDSYAGPSEVCVLVDDSANAAFAAADLLTQVEHAEDNAGFLVSTSREKLFEILNEVHKQLAVAPRAEVIRKALSEFGAAFIVRDLEEATEVVDAIAPEHLTVSTRDPETVAIRVQNAGCLLLGEFTPESAGDFAIGPSHTLPTSTAARFASPLNVLDFLKLQSVSMLTKEALAELEPTVAAFAEMEGFPAHGFGTRIRDPK